MVASLIAALKLVRFHHMLTNNIALNLIGAFNNLQYFGISKILFGAVIFRNPRATKLLLQGLADGPGYY